MKSFTALIACLLATGATAWVPAVTQALSKAAAVAVLGTTLTVSNVDFSGGYSDPNHPNCLRNVEVAGPAATVSGTDGTPGCPADGSGKTWALTGKVEGNTILVDFTPKGGPKDLKGVWEESPNAGIRWPDGNLWALKK